ncbi:bacteriocin-processing peptidase [Paenibacillus algicola]|uniref:Bacteriocin-processing peptidase n=1 Tax=Paenibacillus algicola TaxID=2565926 RepID=A0A4V1G3G5_9BACL|nr:ABC transporter ATP-binding protein [Paenibacillus algicola]QCT01114.1 bacteriocin-processing peptidase [Paenibacillus algicola]
MKRKYAVFTILFSLLLQLTILSFPVITGQLIDLLTASNWEGYVVLLIGICVIPIAQGLLEWGRAFSLTNWSEHRAARLRSRLLSRALQVPIQFFSTSKTGEVVTRSTDDVQQATDHEKMKLEMVEHCAVFLLISVVLWRLNPVLMVIVLLGGLLYMLQTKFIAPRLSQVYARNMGTRDLYNEYVREGIQILPLTIISGKTEWERRKLSQVVQQSRAVEEHTSRLSWMNEAVLKTIEAIITGLIYGSAAYLLLKQQITIGYLVTAISLYFPLIQTFGVASQWVHRYKKYRISSFRIAEVLELSPDTYQQGAVPPEKIERIDFNQVAFSYPGREPILKNVSFTLERGKVIAIVGLSGGGKSTICELLLKLHAPNSGSITVNANHKLADMEGTSWRQKVAYAEQQMFLFTETLRYNLTYGSSQAPFQQVVELAKQLGIHRFIEQREKGYDTPVSNDLSGFSGGQKQKMSLMRTLLKSGPQLLILDEPTSALDYLSEKQLMSAIYKRKESFATLIIAHRLSTILNADTILVLKDGEIVESGTHAELMSSKGHYFSLYEYESMHKSQVDVLEFVKE